MLPKFSMIYLVHVRFYPIYLKTENPSIYYLSKSNSIKARIFFMLPTAPIPYTSAHSNIRSGSYDTMRIPITTHIVL